MTITTTTLDLDDYLAAFAARILQDAFHEATAAYWERRAATFDWAAPRADDFLGHATNADRLEQALRCKAAADACRHRALIAHTTRLEAR